MAACLILGNHELGWCKCGDNSWCFDCMCCWAGGCMGWYIIHTWHWKCSEVSRPGLGADGRDSLSGVSLRARLFWSVQPVADTQGKRQAGLLACTYLPVLSSSSMRPFLRFFHACLKIRWPTHMFVFNLLMRCVTKHSAHITAISLRVKVRELDLFCCYFSVHASSTSF